MFPTQFGLYTALTLTSSNLQQHLHLPSLGLGDKANKDNSSCSCTLGGAPRSDVRALTNMQEQIEQLSNKNAFPKDPKSCVDDSLLLHNEVDK